MKLLVLCVFSFSLALAAAARPGEPYVLTGKEKSIFAIFQADTKKHPELYEGVSYTDYYNEFKAVNQLGDRKLKVGATLMFPHTPASQKIADEEAAKIVEAEAAAARTKAAEEAAALAASRPPPEARTNQPPAAVGALDDGGTAETRWKGIEYFQRAFVATWATERGDSFMKLLDDGETAWLAREARRRVDVSFARALRFHAVPDKKLHVIQFQKPTRPAEFFFAALQRDETTGEVYFYTMEESVSLFGTGGGCVLYQWNPNGEIESLGRRSYTDLRSFLKEFDEE